MSKILFRSHNIKFGVTIEVLENQAGEHIARVKTSNDPLGMDTTMTIKGFVGPRGQNRLAIILDLLRFAHGDRRHTAMSQRRAAIAAWMKEITHAEAK